MTEISPRTPWTLADPAPIDPDTIADAQARGLSARLVRILSRRGPVTRETLAAWFDDPVDALHDPGLLPDADRCRARVDRAAETGERVLVFGDFDADGLTGSAILVLALRARGIMADPWIPHRTEEGHGLSVAAVRHAMEEGVGLIVTADTGTTSHAEIDLAAGRGIDVIVTDHHALPPSLPEAVAVVNPHRADSRYPDRSLSGAGVAFKVAQLILADLPGGPERALGLADLAAVGTIADVVSPEGENRAITRLGLRRLAEGPRPGLRALLESAGVAGDPVGRETVSHRLAPRLNALGRVEGSADGAIALLLAEDADEVVPLVERIEEANRLRRDLTARALAEAREQLPTAAADGILVVAGPWPAGVIGLVAGRLAEETGRAALVLSTVAAPWRGSARGNGETDLAAALRACEGLLVKHGGHAAAAGCQVEPDRVPELREALMAFGRAEPERATNPPLALDLVVGGDAVDFVLLSEIAPLEREGDPPPLLGIAGLIVRRVREVRGGHLQLTLEKGSRVFDAIWFGGAALGGSLEAGAEVDLAARLGARTWNGVEQLRLEIRDLAPAGYLRSLRAGSGSAA